MSDFPQLFPISTLSLPKANKPLPFDLYVKLSSSKFTKILNANSPIDIVRIESYILKGVDCFYIPQTSRLSYLIMCADLLSATEKYTYLISEDGQHLLDEVLDQSLQEIRIKHTFTSQTEVVLRRAVSLYVELIHGHAHLLPSFLVLAKKKQGWTKHAIMTSIFSGLLARSLDPQQKQFIFNCAYAGLLHDIGYTHLKVTEEEHSPALNSFVKNEVRKHPELGVLIVNSIPDFPADVKTAILQHHEAPDGSGYPFRLKGERISNEARIVSLTEMFVTLITGAGANSPLPPSIAAHTLTKSPLFDPRLCLEFQKMLKL